MKNATWFGRHGRGAPSCRPLLVVVLLVVASAASAQVERYVRYDAGGGPTYGLLEGETIRELDGGLFDDPQASGATVKLADVKLLAPVDPRTVYCVGLNYQSHIGDRDPAAVPGIFLKTPGSIIATGDNVVIPKGAENVHFEAELVVVIGREARGVSVDEALDYVFGITLGNDVSARMWQRDDLQWFRGKAIDTFGPIGPAIATGLDLGNLTLVGRLNGETVQESRTDLLIFNVAEIVSFLSTYSTLHPGDVIFTGTPGRTSSMKPGDVFEVEIEGVGVLSNPIVAAD
jgi:2-keto-4-pentenoate hydratase/2-oxohepta-3-ene-1,7-dioic acid hydratase in catechol pathway